MNVKHQTAVLYSVLITAVTALREDTRDDRGDVPGWVMITLMSAVLVAALLAVASPALSALFNEAISKVRTAG
ncbi:hypothetical protein HDA30_000402 [Micrococcus cohnii]|uniref:Uncharacterized protein n=1 Tax=Micrococcus cohnii TaxID=993416 RepID=A0A7W7GML2_9MICC|nr:hypothetical protein [Micrococcus cohnii]MBB4734894.1 hypothetical protein [Micrococcus cohnii]